AFGGLAERALDGNHDGNWLANSVTHTTQESYPTWAASFAKKSSLGMIRVWNRTDSESQRLNDFVLFGQVGQYVHPGAAGEVTNIWPMSIQNPTAWYPTISTILGPTTATAIYVPRFDFLSLAEVELFGQPVAQCGQNYGHCCAAELGATCANNWVCSKSNQC